jgi:hypothetical protein
MRRIISAVATTAALALFLAAGASAHTLTVTPPGQDDPVHLHRPVAQPWVQGHCRAQAPAELGDSPGVAQFSPAAALPCPPVMNPGGQITGP